MRTPTSFNTPIALASSLGVKALLRALFLVFGLASLGMSSTAFAGALDDYRAAGQLGEANTGYLEARDGSSGEAKTLAKSVNAKRRALYESRAAKEGVKASDVGQVFAKEIAKKAPKGTWIQSSGGSWSRK